MFDHNRGLTYPDFISRDSEARVIADAKYKPIDNIGNKDYLQVLAYMFRFDAKKGFYFYPEMGEEERALLLVIPLVLRAIIKHKNDRPCLIN